VRSTAISVPVSLYVCLSVCLCLFFCMSIHPHILKSHVQTLWNSLYMLTNCGRRSVVLGWQCNCKLQVAIHIFSQYGGMQVGWVKFAFVDKWLAIWIGGRGWNLLSWIALYIYFGYVYIFIYFNFLCRVIFLTKFIKLFVHSLIWRLSSDDNGHGCIRLMWIYSITICCTGML